MVPKEPRQQGRRLWGAKRAGICPVFIWEASIPGWFLALASSLELIKTSPIFWSSPTPPLTTPAFQRQRQSLSSRAQTISPRAALSHLGPCAAPRHQFLVKSASSLWFFTHPNCPAPLPFTYFRRSLPIQSTGFLACLLPSSLKMNSPSSI